MASPEILSLEPGQMTDVLYVLVAVRATWLLPDWLAKWQMLVDRRRTTVERQHD